MAPLISDRFVGRTWTSDDLVGAWDIFRKQETWENPFAAKPNAGDLMDVIEAAEVSRTFCHYQGLARFGMAYEHS